MPVNHSKTVAPLTHLQVRVKCSVSIVLLLISHFNGSDSVYESFTCKGKDQALNLQEKKSHFSPTPHYSYALLLQYLQFTGQT